MFSFCELTHLQLKREFTLIFAAKLHAIGRNYWHGEEAPLRIDRRLHEVEKVRGESLFEANKGHVYGEFCGRRKCKSQRISHSCFDQND